MARASRRALNASISQCAVSGSTAVSAMASTISAVRPR
jgi:hypothetical protein